MRFSVLLILIFTLLSTSYAQAEKEVIQFPDEELETETVLPVFPNREAVKGRLITLTGKFEGGIYAGSSLNEAFYEPIIFGFSGTYHFDEYQAVKLSYIILSTTLNQNAKKYRETSLVGANAIDVSRMPAPGSQMSAEYEYSAFYGKISLSKQQVFNTSTYFTAGLGMLDFEGNTEMSINLGLGQRVYFSENWGINIAFSLVSYQGPDPTKTATKPLVKGGPKLAYSAFGKRSYLNQTLTVGGIFTF